MDNYTIGKNLKSAREGAGYTQRDLSEISGISNAEISRIESGVRKSVGSESIIRLCYALNVSSDWLLGIPYDKFIGTYERMRKRPYILQKKGVANE